MKLPYTLRFSIYAVMYLALCLVSTAQPIHIYLTYSDTPETSIDINIIMPDRTGPVDIYYDDEPRHEILAEYRLSTSAIYVPTPIELADGRKVYIAQLKKLKPGTQYSFIAGNTNDGFSRELKFRTLPGGNAPIRFINGGDMGVDTRANMIQRVAAKSDPDFAVIGGDLAYANGLIGNLDLWDKWLNNWQTLMKRSDGSMIPIVTCIGNHEVNKYKTDISELRSPWYFSLFGRQGEELYYSRTVGDTMVFFVLDSGYHHNFEGKQSEWLKMELEKYKHIPHKFAVYHMPMYPAFSDYSSERRQLARASWATLFDEYGVRVAFEHDDHVAKRSKPLKANRVEEGGTVYIGDGAFGRESRNVDRTVRWYNSMEKSVVHFWQVDVTHEAVKLQAIDRKRQVFDTLQLP